MYSSTAASTRACSCSAAASLSPAHTRPASTAYTSWSVQGCQVEPLGSTPAHAHEGTRRPGARVKRQNCRVCIGHGCSPGHVCISTRRRPRRCGLQYCLTASNQPAQQPPLHTCGRVLLRHLHQLPHEAQHVLRHQHRCMRERSKEAQQQAWPVDLPLCQLLLKRLAGSLYKVLHPGTLLNIHHACETARSSAQARGSAACTRLRQECGPRPPPQ
jgi:hypothetical protein